MDIRAQVGMNLRRFRQRAGISQEELALRAEINRGYINGIERAVRNPTVVVLAKLATVLDIEPAEFLIKTQNK